MRRFLDNLPQFQTALCLRTVPDSLMSQTELVTEPFPSTLIRFRSSDGWQAEEPGTEAGCPLAVGSVLLMLVCFVLTRRVPAEPMPRLLHSRFRFGC